MSCRLRYDQCCAEVGCLKPARHADLCAAHYSAASAAVRACADLLDRIDAPRLLSHLELLADACALDGGDTEAIDSVGLAEACALEDLYELPAYQERRAA